MGHIRAIVKMLAFIPLCLLSYLLLAGCDLLRLPPTAKYHTVRLLYWMCMALLGLRVRLKGELAPGPALIVANHCSYTDVLAIASLGNIFFTPKSEVRDWPLVGPVVGRFQVLFVDRKPGQTRRTQQMIFAHLRKGGRICVFPEATTSDGRRLLPFKSSLFSLAEQWEGPQPLTVQPVTVVYRSVNGRPMNDEVWPKVAWYGDIDIVRHLLLMFSLRRVEVEALAHPPITLQEGETRKELCRRAEAIIVESYPYGKEANGAC